MLLAVAYRSTAATDAFERLNDAVIACLGPDATITQYQSVNHPDFYDLRLYLMADQEIGVSLKDKAALQQTYVFCGPQGRTNRLVLQIGL